MPQEPQGPPKGTADFYEYMRKGIKDDPNFTIPSYLYRIARESNKRGFDISGIDPAAIIAARKDDPEYKDSPRDAAGTPQALIQEIEAMKTLRDMVPSAWQLAQNYTVPTTWLEKHGYWASPLSRSVKGGESEYTTASQLGGNQPLGGNRQQLAASQLNFIDINGFSQPLTPKELSRRKFSVESQVVTDPTGMRAEKVYLKELPPDAAGMYGKEVFSSWGAKPTSRNAIWGGLLQAANQIPGVPKLLAGRLFEADRQEKIKVFMDMMDMIDLGDLSPAEVEDALGSGVWDVSIAQKMVDGRNVAKGNVRDYRFQDPTMSTGLRKAKDISDAVASDLAGYKERAAKGSVRDQAALQVYWAVEQYNGRNVIAKLYDDYQTNKRLYDFPTSYNADNNQFTSLEGIASIVGSVAGQLATQRAITTGVAKLLLEKGGSSLVTRAIGQQVEQVVAGKKVTALAGGETKLLTELGSDVAEYVGILQPSLMMSAEMYGGARDVGFSQDQAIGIALLSLPMVGITEKVTGNKWMFRSMQEGGGQKAYRNAVADWLRVPENAAEAKKGNIMGLYGKTLEFLRKGSESNFVNYVKNYVKAVGAETVQEMTEEWGYEGVEKFADYATGQYLYEKNRPKGYSALTRVAEAGLGALIGTTPHALMTSHTRTGGNPFEGGIASAVASGQGDKIMDIATELQREGVISKELFGALKQEVDLNTHSMETLRMTNPELFGQVGENTMVDEYLNATTAIRTAQEGLAQVEERLKSGTVPEGETFDPKKLEADKAAFEAQVKENQQVIDRINSGEAFMDRLLDRTVMADAIANGRKDVVSSRSVHAVSEQFRKYSKLQNDLEEGLRNLRLEHAPEIAQAIEDLRVAKPEDTAAMYGNLKTVLKRNEGLISREDARRYIKAIGEAKQRLVELLADQNSLSPAEDGSAQTIRDAYAKDPMVEQAGIDLEDWISSGEGDKLASLDEKEGQPDIRKFLMRDIMDIQADLSSRGRNADEIEMDTQGRYPEAEDIGKSKDSVKLWEDFIASMAGEPFDKLLDRFRELPTGTLEAVDAITNIKKLLSFAIASHKMIAGPVSDLAESALNDKTGNMPGRELPWYGRMKADNEEVYGPAKAAGNGFVASLEQLAKDYQTEADRLGASLNERKEAISRTRHVSLYQRYDLIHQFLLDGPVPEKEYGDTVKLLTEELDKVRDKDKDGRPGPVKEFTPQAEMYISRLEDMISVALLKNPNAGVKFIKEYLARNFPKKATISSSYNNTVSVEKQRPADWNVQDLFGGSERDARWDHLAENGGLAMLNAQAQGMRDLLVAWVNKLSHVRYADMVKVYGEVIAKQGTKVPHAEQRERILEAIAFLVDVGEEGDHRSRSLLEAAGVKKGAGMIRGLYTISGIPGAGKTEMTPIIMDAVAKLRGKPISIAVVSPGENNATALTGKLQQRLGSSKEFGKGIKAIRLSELEAANGMDLLAGYDFVIIDEAHAVKFNMVGQLKAFMDASPNTKLLALGDPDQAPPITESQGAFPLQRSGMRSVPMQVAFRQNNPEVLQLIDIARDAGTSDISGMKSMPSFNYTKDGRGVRLIKTSIDDVVEEFLKALEDTSGNRSSDVRLIVGSNKDRDAIVAQYKARLGAHEGKVLTMDVGAASALGIEADQVFVALDRKTIPMNYMRFFYTAASRGRNGVVAYYPDLNSAESREVGEIREIPSGNDEITAQWADSAKKFGPTFNDLSSRSSFVTSSGTPKQGPTTSGEEPGPEEDHEEDAGPLTESQHKRKAGRKVWLSKAYQKKNPGGYEYHAFQELTILSDTKAGETITVQAADGSKIEGLTERDLVVKQPKIPADWKPKPKPKPVPEDEGPLPPMSEDEKVTLAGRESMVFNGLPGSTNSFAFDLAVASDPSVETQGVESLLRKGNPAYDDRMKLLEALSKIQDEGLVTVDLVPVTTRYARGLKKSDRASLNTPLGSTDDVMAFEIRLTNNEATSGTTADLLQKLFGDHSYQNAEKAGRTTLGTIYINTKTKEGHPYAKYLEEMGVRFGDGTDKNDFTALAIQSIQPGVRHYEQEVVNGRTVMAPVFVPYKVLLADIEKKGFAASKPQMYSESIGEALTVKGPNGEERKVSGVAIKVSPWENGPETVVFMHMPNADEGYYGEMKGELDALADNEELTADDLKNTKAYNFLQWNRSLLTDPDGNAFTDPIYSELLHINERHAIVSSASLLSDPVNYKQKLGGVIERMRQQDKGRGGITFTRPVMTKKNEEGKGTGELTPETVDQLIANTDRVNMPRVVVEIPVSVAQKVGEQYKAPPSVAENEESTVRHREKDNSDVNGRRTSVKSVESYVSRVLGDRFLKGQLDFKPRVVGLDGRELYGIMERGRIALETKDGTVLYGVDRHEAVHYVIDNLLDEESKAKVLQAARELYAKENGVDPGTVTDEQQNEYIAKDYENPRYDTSTFYGRFMRWLHNIFGRWNKNRKVIRDLLYRMENGDFRDVPSRNSEAVRYSAKANPDQDGAYDATPEEEGSGPLNYRDRSLLRKVFSTSSKADNVVRMVARDLYNQSMYGPTTKYMAKFGEKGVDFNGAIGKLFAHYSGMKEAAAKDATTYVDYSKFTQDQVDHIMSSGDSADYVNFMLADPDTFKVVLQSVFPGVQVNSDMSLGQSDEGTFDFDGNIVQDTSAYVHNTNENLNWQDRQSDLTRLSLLSMSEIAPQRHTKDESGIYSPIETGDPSDIDRQLLDSILHREAQGILTALLEAGKDRMELLGDRLLEVWKKDPSSPEGRAAYTFHKRYLATIGTYMNVHGEQTYSYAYMARNRKRLLAEHRTDSLFYLSLLQRIEHAEDVLNNVVRGYLELSMTDRMITEHFQGKGEWKDEIQGISHPNPGFRYVYAEADSIRRMRTEINDGVRMGFIADGEHVGLGGDFRSRWSVGLPTDPKEAPYSITEKGVKDSSGNLLVELVKKNFVLRSDNIGQIHDFLNSAGYPVSSRTIEYLVQKAQDGGQDSDLLPKLIGHWAMSIHAGIHRVESGKFDTDLWSNKVIAQTGVPSSMESAESIAGNLTNEEGMGLKGDYPMPSMFFTLNEKLAEVENRTKGANYISRMISPDNRAIYPVALGTTFSLYFPSASGGRYTSQSAEEMRGELLASNPALAATRNGQTEWLEPILDPEDPWKFMNVYQSTGVKSNDMKGADPNHISLDDRLFFYLDTFAKSALRQGAKEQMVVAGSPFGDRNTDLFYTLVNPLKGGRLFNVNRSEKGMTVKMNAQNVLPLIKKAFNLRKQTYNKSLQRWGEYFGKPGMTEAEVRTKLAKEDPVKVQQSLLVTNNSDYRIQDGKVRPGNAITFADSSIYNARNLESIGSDHALMMLYEPYIQKMLADVKSMNYIRRSINGFKLDDKSMEELVRGFFFMHHFVSKSASNVVLGTPDRYSSALDYQKRSVLAFSPGHLPMIGSSGISEKSNVAFFPDMYDPRTGLSVFDGFGITLPWAHAMLKRAYGGQGGIMKDASNKRIISSPDLHVKYSEAPVTAELYNMNHIYRNLTRRALVIDGDARLLEVWDSIVPKGEDITPAKWNYAVNKILREAQKHDLMGGMISVMATPDSVKSGMRGLNLMQDVENLDHTQVQGLTRIGVDNRHWRYQTRLQRSLEEESLKSPYVSQISFLMGLSESSLGSADTLHELEGKLTSAFLFRLGQQIDKMTGETRGERVKAWMKQNGMHKVNSQGILGQVADILTDPEGNIDNPLAARKVVEYLANKVSKDGLLPKMKGQMFTQISAGGFQVWDEMDVPTLLSAEDEAVMAWKPPTAEELFWDAKAINDFGSIAASVPSLEEVLFYPSDRTRENIEGLVAGLTKDFGHDDYLTKAARAIYNAFENEATTTLAAYEDGVDPDTGFDHGELLRDDIARSNVAEDETVVTDDDSYIDPTRRLAEEAAISNSDRQGSRPELTRDRLLEARKKEYSEALEVWKAAEDRYIGELKERGGGRDLTDEETAMLERQTEIMKNRPTERKRVRRDLLPPRWETVTDPETGESKRVYKPGEVLMPFLFAKQFGITDINMSMDQMRSDIHKRMGLEGLAQFERAMEVFVARTPSSGVGSGHWMKVVGFINSIGNGIVVPTGFNQKTGGDYDGDQLSVLIRDLAVDENGVYEVGGSGTQELQARIMDTLHEFYHDPANEELTMMNVGTDRLKAVIKQLQDEDPQNYGENRSELFTPTESADAKDRANAGVNLISIGASYMRSYAELVRSYMLTAKDGESPVFKGWAPAMRDSEGNLVIDNISQMLNGMLDNTKGMFMGHLNINERNISVVMGALMRGKTLYEAVKLANDPTVKDAVRKLEDRSSFSKNKGDKEYSSGMLAELIKNNQQAENAPEGTDATEMGGRSKEQASELLLDGLVGEVASSMTRLLSIPTKGVPYDIEGMQALRAATEWTLGTSWENLLSGNPVDPSILKEMEVLVNDNAKASRAFVAKYFDAVEMMRSLPNRMEFLRAVQYVDRMTGDALMVGADAVQSARRQVLASMSQGLTFKGDGEKLWQKNFDSMLVSLHLDKEFGGKPMRLTDGLPPIDLGATGGQYRFVMEFSGWFERMRERVEALHPDDRRRGMYVKNAFIDQLRKAGNDVPRIEMRDNRKLMSDPEKAEEVRDAAKELNLIFSGVDVFPDLPMPMERMMEVYSLIKDGFSSSKESMARLFSGNEVKKLGRTMSMLSELFRDKDAKWTLSDGTVIPHLGMLALLKDHMVQNNPTMLPGSAKAAKGNYFQGTENGRAVVKNKRWGNTLWVSNPWSRLTPMFDLRHDGMYTMANTIKGLPTEIYTQLYQGKSSEVNVPEDSLLASGSKVTLPTGDTTEVIGRNGSMALLDAPVLKSDPEKDKADPMKADGQPQMGSMWYREVVNGTKTPYGKDGRELSAMPLWAAYKLIAARSLDPRNAELASFLAQQEDRFRRIGIVSMDETMPQRKIYGEATKKGDLKFSPGMETALLEHVVLHEAIHRYAHGVFYVDEERLDAKEKDYRRKMNAAYDAFKSVDSFAKDHYGFKDVGEFVAEIMSNQVFADHLRRVERGSLWRSIVNALRSLFGPNATNSYVDQIIRDTREFIEYETENRRDFKPGYNANMKAAAASMGIHDQEPIKDSKDLLDHLMTDSGSLLKWSDMAGEDAVNEIMRIIDRDKNREKLVDGVRFTVHGLSDVEKRQYIKEKVLPLVSTREQTIKNAMVSVLNSGDVEAEWDERMKDSMGTSYFESKDAVNSVIRQVDHRPATYYVRHSDLKDSSKIIGKDPLTGKDVTVGDLGLKYTPGFDGMDPIVQVHKNFTGKTVVSLVDVTTKPLAKKGQNRKFLLRNYVKGFFDGKIKRLSMTNDQGGAMSMGLALSAMAMMQANPGVKFDRIKVLSSAGKALQHNAVWMMDALNEVALIRDTPALAERLPENLKKVINDKALYDGTKYDQPVMDHYMEWLEQNYEHDGDGYFGHGRLMEQISRAVQDGVPDIAQYRKALFARQKAMLEQYHLDELAKNPEWTLLSRAIVEMENMGAKGVNTRQDTSKYGANLKSASNQSNDAVQLLIRAREIGTMKIAKLSGDFRNKLHKAIEKLPARKNLGSMELADRGWKQFERSWITGKAKDRRTGGLVDIFTGTIHWDKEAPETKRALREGLLSQSELDFNNKVLDWTHEYLVKSVAHGYIKNLTFIKKDGNANVDKAWKMAEERVSKEYPRGLLPVVGRPSSESFGRTEFGQAFKKFMQGFQNINNLYDENLYDMGSDDKYVSHPYMMEMDGLQGLSPYGGQNRLDRLGLRVVDGDLWLEEPLKNNDATRNIERIMASLQLATDRQVIHEDETLPIKHAVQAYLRSEPEWNSTEQEHNLSYVEEYAKKLIYNRKIEEDARYVDANVAPYIHMGINATSFVGVALSYKVALASAIFNMTQTMALSFANIFTQDGMFKPKHLAKAIATAVTPDGYKLMSALMEAHFVNDAQEQDQLHSFRKGKTVNRNLFSSHVMNIGNFATDHAIRGIVMMSQMIHDGSLKAYSLDADGNLQYDERKDDRFYTDGKLTADGKVLREAVKNSLIDDGVYGQTEDGKLVQGYDMRSMRNFKSIADQYVVGGMDKGQQVMLNNVWYGRMFLTFKNFAINRMYNWAGRTEYKDDSGRWVVSTNEKGEKVAEWEKRKFTSYLHALSILINNVREGSKMGVGALQRLDSSEKRALMKMSIDLMVLITGLTAWSLARGGDDDKDKGKRSDAEKRMLTILRQLASDGLTGSPFQLLSDYGNPVGSIIPVASYAYRLATLPMNPENAWKLSPGHTTFEDAADLYRRHQKNEGQ